MRPIDDPADLDVGATLYHSAFGFAHVTAMRDGAVDLSWERPGTHLPTTVRHDNLRRVYSHCRAEGFFDRATRDAEAVREQLLHAPADALLDLVDDLGGPQRIRDLMDWLVGRDLFTPKTFVRWWGTSEALVRADGRLSWEGEWVDRASEDADADEPPPPLVQLEPGLVDARGDGFDDGEETLPPEDYATDDSAWMPDEGFDLAEPVSLVAARPPASRFLALGLALADALARAHAQGQAPLHPMASAVELQPDGAVTLQPGVAEHALRPRGERPGPASDVYAAAGALTEGFLGRPLGDVLPDQLLPFLRHRLPDLPPSALAPLGTALAVEPADRPDAATWRDQWAAVVQAETDRAAALSAGVSIRLGYDSHIGRVKVLQTQVNQDALHLSIRGRRRLAVLCDGISISDAGRGDLASHLATQAMARLWDRVPIDKVSLRRLLDRGLDLANRAICDRAKRLAGGDLTGRMPMGTTATVVALEDNRVHLAWLGDSRAFLVGDWGIAQLTADDNVSGETFLGWCDGTRRTWHPDGHALVRYLGHFDEHQQPAAFPAHHATFVLRPGERLFLCSDGLTDYVAPDEPSVLRRILPVAREGAPDVACRALTELANRHGGGDNISVMCLAAQAPASG